MKKLKSDFTINQIGKFQFYSGILIGIGLSLIFNSLLRQISKISDFGNVLAEPGWGRIINYEFSLYHLAVIGYTSVAFAFCFTTYLWMSKPTARVKRKTLKLRFARVNSFWILFGSLIFLSRMIWFIGGIEISLEKDFPYLGFMFPIFLYMYCWNLISDIYKSKKPFLLTTLVLIISGYILSGI